MKAMNSTTGTVHYAHFDGEGIVQDCGIKHNQILFLHPVADDTEVTCGKCHAPKPAKKITVRRTFGSGEWTLAELREIAKDLGIQGRTSKTGDELLSLITPIRSHVH